MKPPIPPQVGLVAQLCQWQLLCCFGGADNEANNTAAVAVGGVNNCQWRTHPWSAACAMKPPMP
jgi:hypothetical protein